MILICKPRVCNPEMPNRRIEPNPWSVRASTLVRADLNRWLQILGRVLGVSGGPGGCDPRFWGKSCGFYWRLFYWKLQLQGVYPFPETKQQGKRASENRPLHSPSQEAKGSFPIPSIFRCELAVRFGEWFFSKGSMGTILVATAAGRRLHPRYRNLHFTIK